MFKIINKKESLDEFINKINDSLQIKIDKNTFDYELFSTLYAIDASFKKAIDKHLESMDYENKSGTDLDKYFKLFNIYRLKGNNGDIYNFDIILNANETFLIKKGSIIEYKGYKYKTLKEVQVLSNEKNTIPTQKTFNSYTFDNPIYFASGKAKISLENIISSTQDQGYLITMITKSLKIISMQIQPNDIESDFRFLERSKSILQSLGFSNNKKIENELLKDKRIRNVYFSNQNGLTTIVIFPNLFKELESIIEYSQEVVNYYQNSNVQVVGPNIMEINIKGLKTQIIHLNDYNRIISEINNRLKDMFSNAFIDNSIKRQEILNLITKIINEFDVDLSLNLKKIYIQNYYYRYTNYKEPILIEDISDKLNLGEFNMLSLGKVM